MGSYSWELHMLGSPKNQPSPLQRPRTPPTLLDPVLFLVFRPVFLAVQGAKKRRTRQSLPCRNIQLGLQGLLGLQGVWGRGLRVKTKHLKPYFSVSFATTRVPFDALCSSEISHS